MTRKKVKLAFITNNATRKATYKKRKKGLIKKVNELSTLCDIDACAIIYSSYDPQPEVYPSPEEAERILTRFQKMPEMDKTKKMVNQESFLRQRIDKATEQLKKQRKENREKEITRLMFQSLTGAKSLQGVNIVDLNDLGWMIDQNLKDITRRMERLGVGEGRPVHAAAVVAEERLRNGGGGGGEGAVVAAADKPHPQWFVDLMMNAAQEEKDLGLGNDMMLPLGGQNGHWANGFFP